MSRPLKRGLSYWRKDVNWYADPKVKKIGRRVGAAGQAIQNMNLIMGLPETTGLYFPAMYP